MLPKEYCTMATENSSSNEYWPTLAEHDILSILKTTENKGEKDKKTQNFSWLICARFPTYHNYKYLFSFLYQNTCIP